MSVPHHYHQPNAPDQSDDESASDLDLDVDELAPSLSPRAQPSPAHRAANFDYSRRIPLRSIRARNRDAYNDADGEDTQHLLEDGLDDESALARDPDAPLLRSPSANQAVGNALSRLGSLLPASSRRAPGDAEEPENDHDPAANRLVSVGLRQPSRFPINAISNSRYTPWSFLPVTLFNEFKFFINMYFLMVALSQVIPALRIGYLFSYILPLSLVITVSLGKEAWDDITRRRRDAEANSEPFTVLKFGAEAKNGRKRGSRKAANGSTTDHSQNGSLPGRPRLFRDMTKPSRDIKVGDVVKLKKNQRVPADIIILQCKAHESQQSQAVHAEASLIRTDSNEETNADTASQQVNAKSSDTAETFIRTDQLDGETDWKLRLASPLSQGLDIADFTKLKVVAGKPDRKVNEFVGMLEFSPGEPSSDASSSATSVPLTVDNTAWANTVIASSGTVYGVVIYTGSQTRQAMSTSQSRPKVGLLEMEINNMTKILCCISLSLSLLLVLLGRIEHQGVRPWYVTTLRFLILFSTVIPISLRVNLDMGKVVYAWYIEHDNSIPETVVRTSTIPEDLGRVEFLLSDKTGTLTQNEMDLKKVHVGTVSYANEAMDEVSSYVNQAFGSPASESSSTTALITPSSTFHVPAASATRMRREIGARVRDLVLALAICHNVTPTTEESEDGHEVTTYQASSPDEIAIVQWTEAVGLKLLQRDRTGMVLQSSKTNQIVVRVRILHIFPFTSEGKRMGIVVKFSTSENDDDTIEDESEIWFYQKGADTVMSSIVLPSDWLDEETSNMAREGLRTLVVGRKRISPAQYREFSHKYSEAALSLHARDAALGEVVKAHLEKDVELLGITGVEDKLQKDVKGSLELLRNAGIKIWMLTGDKVETARCVAVSSKLVSRGQPIHTIAKMKRKDAALDSLQSLSSNTSAALLVDGESLALLLKHHPQEFITIASRLPSVIACRVSPIQKAELANLVKSHSGKRVCCIGDGGNDVSMIQAADVGVGIVGKEGKQASLAADFSIMQFRYLTKLLVWHGRNSYKRSAKLAQFVIHRGVIMSVCQVMFSIASQLQPNALYRDWLMVGYATLYTFAPVFSLVLDRDVDERLSTLYPELYKELTLGRSLSYRTFFIWLGVSVYQGCLIQGLSQLLIKDSLVEQFKRMVAVSYTSLVLNELIMVAVEVTTWHPIMVATILATAAAFFGSLPFLGGYMELAFLVTPGFVWRVVVILAISLGPIYAAKVIGRRVRPPNYRKVMHV